MCRRHTPATEGARSGVRAKSDCGVIPQANTCRAMWCTCAWAALSAAWQAFCAASLLQSSVADGLAKIRTNAACATAALAVQQRRLCHCSACRTGAVPRRKSAAQHCIIGMSIRDHLATPQATRTHAADCAANDCNTLRVVRRPANRNIIA